MRHEIARRHKAAYDADFVSWLQDQTEALRNGAWHDLDIKNLVEEIEDVSRRQRRAIFSRVRQLELRILKQMYQPEKNSNSWESTILEQVYRIAALLKDSPSLADALEEAKVDEYARARSLALLQTGLRAEAIPVTATRAFTERLDETLLRSAPGSSPTV